MDKSIVLSGREKEILKHINSKIDIDVPICESGKFSKQELLERIRESYKTNK